ncbi:putative ATP dependent RNA helicase [Blastocladiella britannica]|nr:putative ATP dependent RNA helicase [Blastocladiella britannica]
MAETDLESGLAERLAPSFSTGSLSPAAARLHLPIVAHRRELLYAVESNPVTIVVGHTGCGKSTQLPQYLHEAGWTKSGTRSIAVTQPRRVAAISLATRVAEEMGNEPVGGTVGYAVRFDEKTSPATVIRYTTDGALVRECMADPLLSKYSVIMVDEAHERSTSTDILLGLLKLILVHRSDLRIIVSSATLDANAFLAYFTKKAPVATSGVIVSLEGRSFPLDIMYLSKPCLDYLTAAVDTVLDLHQREPLGDVLVFLTGRDDIERAAQMLADRAKVVPSAFALLPLPLHAGQPTSAIEPVFAPAPAGTRKAVLSTNLAEASVTIPGIVHVVDCGFAKLRYFHATSMHSSLRITPISQAAADQRAGRAGRTRPGKVYRLWTERERLVKCTSPELLRGNLVSPLVTLMYLGVKMLGVFPFLDSPPVDRFAAAMELLRLVDIVDSDGCITEMGRRVAEMPVDPTLAVMILKSVGFGCVQEMVTIAAMLSIDKIFTGAGGHDAAGFRQIEFAVEEGDHLMYLNVFLAFDAANQLSSWCQRRHVHYASLLQAARIRAHLLRILIKYGIDASSSALDSDDADHDGGGDPTENIRRCVTAACFPQAAAVNHDGSYSLLRDGTTAWIHPSSALYERAPKYVVFHGVVETDNKVWMTGVLAVDPKWLVEYGGEYYKYQKVGK